MARKKTPTTYAPGQYNTSVWQVQDGVAFSVAVVELVDGRVMRHNGRTCTGLEGSSRFHDYFMSYETTFCGKPVQVFITPGTDGFRNAICGGIDKTFKSLDAKPLLKSV